MQLLRENGTISVNDIIDRFGVSEATARRDLEALERDKKLLRTFGGAILETVRTEIPFFAKMDMNPEEKSEIAKKALTLIQEGDVIGLTGGSTNMFIARLLRQRAFERLTVVTNAINIAYELAGQPGLQLIVTGGIIRTQSFELSGPLADLTLGQLTIQKTFMGADGVSLTRGITTFDELEAHTNRMMMRHSLETYVVADYTKLGRDSIFLIDEIAAITALLTDSHPHTDIRRMLASSGVTVL